MLPEIHDLADRWLRLGCNEHQIQPRLARFTERRVPTDDANLFSIGTDEANLKSPDLLVDEGSIATLRAWFLEYLQLSITTRPNPASTRDGGPAPD
jgi:hypothetical protein